MEVLFTILENKICSIHIYFVATLDNSTWPTIIIV